MYLKGWEQTSQLERNIWTCTFYFSVYSPLPAPQLLELSILGLCTSTELGHYFYNNQNLLIIISFELPVVAEIGVKAAHRSQRDRYSWRLPPGFWSENASVWDRDHKVSHWFDSISIFRSTHYSVRRIRRIHRIQRTLRHKPCASSGTIVCPPFGLVPSCLGVSLSKLSTTLSSLNSLASGCSTLYFQSCTFQDWEAHMSVTFQQASSILTDASYHAHSSNITSITLCLRHLENSLPLRRQISSHLVVHQPNSMTEVHRLLNNLDLLFEVLHSLRSVIQRNFWDMLDFDAQASAEKLRRVMASVSLSLFCANIFSFWSSNRSRQQNATSLSSNMSLGDISLT